MGQRFQSLSAGHDFNYSLIYNNWTDGKLGLKVSEDWQITDEMIQRGHTLKCSDNKITNLKKPALMKKKPTVEQMTVK